MKIIVKAKEDVTRHVGALRLDAKAGDKLELSSAEAEVALSTGSFEYVDTVPETKSETSAVESQQSDLEAQKAELMDLSERDLHERAKKLDGYKKSMNKGELAELLVQPQPPVPIPDAQNNPPANGENSGE